MFSTRIYFETLHTKYIFRFSDFLFNGFYWRFFKGTCREIFLDKGFMQWVVQGVYAMGCTRVYAMGCTRVYAMG
jgi:hypothetical protein